MTRSLLAVMMAAVIAPVSLPAQQPTTANEKAVWALIESSAKTPPKVTDDIVFVSGAYPRPLVGRARFEPSDTAMANADAQMQKRSAQVLATHPQKVVVSKSGDMAYGFSLFNMEFDRPDSTGKNEHVKFEGSQLTVWRKMGGEWRLAASFNRPNE